ADDLAPLVHRHEKPIGLRFQLPPDVLWRVVPRPQQVAAAPDVDHSRLIADLERADVHAREYRRVRLRESRVDGVTAGPQLRPRRAWRRGGSGGPCSGRWRSGPRTRGPPATCPVAVP